MAKSKQCCFNWQRLFSSFLPIDLLSAVWYNYQLEILDRSDREVMQYVQQCPSHLGLITEPEHWHGKHSEFTLIRTYHLQLCVNKDNQTVY